MSYQPFVYPPGIFRNGTEYECQGRWYDGNLIRFHNGRVQPVGGWTRVTDTVNTVYATPPRALLSYKLNNGLRKLAVGTSQKLYVHDGDVVVDVTPAGFTAGRDYSLIGQGYGAQEYGDYPTATPNTYGTPRGVPSSSTLTSEATNWTLDLWGELLIACSNSDGKIYEWDGNPANDAIAVSLAPVSNVAALVTEQRVLMAFGAGGDPRKIQWSDIENRNVWTPTATNAAGSKLIKSTGKIRAGANYRGQVLVITDKDAWLGDFVGRPLVYNFVKIGDQCGIPSTQAMARVGEMIVWMGTDKFFVFDGFVRPLRCDVLDWIFGPEEGGINRAELAKIACGINEAFNEVWWSFPRAGSSENTHYAAWNWLDDHWTIGELARSAYTRGSIWGNMVAANPNGKLYLHESGMLDDGASRLGEIYIQGAPLEIGAGDQVMDASQMLVNVTCASTRQPVSFSFKSRETPDDAEITYGPYLPDASGRYVDVRLQGRQLAMRIESEVDDVWHVGPLRLDVEPLGGR